MKVVEGLEVIFKTASGELVPSTSVGVFEGLNESGTRCRLQGSMAEVHKPLVSAYKRLGHGRIAILDAEGGQIVPAKSKEARAIKRILETAQWGSRESPRLDLGV